MHNAIINMSLFKPNFAAVIPPMMPPSVKQAIPIVPYAIPYWADVRPIPPELLESTRKGVATFTSWDSPSLYNRKNISAGTTPGFVKNETNTSL